MLRSTFLAAAGGVVATAVAPAALAQGEMVTVFAAASLREAFEAAGPAFTRASGFPVRYSFGGSDTLAAQLLAGAPADVFASANEAQMRRAVDGGAAVAPVPLARNHLVVVVPAAHATVTLRDLGARGANVVLAGPSVPAGVYARRAFAAMGADYAARVNANVVSEEADVKAVLTKVVLGEADAGVVYATDVTPAVAEKVRVLQFPDGAAPEAVYPIAVCAKPVNLAGAKAFVAFVTSAAGRAFLSARGFA